MRCLVTGTAGFIGFYVAKRLLEQGHEVTGVDGMVPYYDVKLKQDRHARLKQHNGFSANVCMLEDKEALTAIAEQAAPDLIVHLAAQAGVRHSLEFPGAYIDSNLVGSFNVLELARTLKPGHLVMASTSSVYGASEEYPFAENDDTDHPLTLYSATKKSMETMAHCYSHIWKTPTTVLRFFSAYGPWGRPDMALFKFVKNTLAGEPIDIYNHGQMQRDWTYIDDLVEGIVRLCGCVPESGAPVSDVDSLSPVAPYRIVNIGGGTPTSLMHFIEEIERALGKPAIRNYIGMQVGDVVRSEAATDLLQTLIGFRPATPIATGIGEFVRWYRDYYSA